VTTRPTDDAATPCECGAAAACRPVWYAALAEEQLDPVMGQWHNTLVCVFALQHASMFDRRHADSQLQFLQLAVDEGPDAVNAVARSLRARNKGRGFRLEAPELSRYPGIGDTELPASFPVSLHHLLCADGEFLTDGHDAYGLRMRQLAAATVEAYRS